MLDRCAAFDDAVVGLQDRDPLRDKGPFAPLAVTGRQWSAASALARRRSRDRQSPRPNQAAGGNGAWRRKCRRLRRRPAIGIMSASRRTRRRTAPGGRWLKACRAAARSTRRFGRERVFEIVRGFELLVIVVGNDVLRSFARDEIEADGDPLVAAHRRRELDGLRARDVLDRLRRADPAGRRSGVTCGTASAAVRNAAAFGSRPGIRVAENAAGWPQLPAQR